MKATAISRLTERRWLPLATGGAVAVTALVLWQVVAAREEDHLQPSSLPETVLVVGLLLGGLLAAVLYMVQKRQAWTRGIEEAHADLRRAEQRFRATIESAPVGMVLVDDRGAMVLVNAETEKLFGYRREELLGKPVEALIPERYRGAHPGHRAEFCAMPEARRMGAGRDLFALRKDGSEVPVEIGLSPVTTEEGLFVLAAIADISERKRAEREVRELNERLEQRVAERTAQAEARTAHLQHTAEALKREIAKRERAEKALQHSEERHRLMESLATDGMWDWDLETGEEYLSPRWKQQLGYQDHELPNHASTWQRLIVPEDLGVATKAFAEHIEQGKPFHLTVRYVHKNGSTVWVICRGVALRDETGKPYRMIGTHTDITRLMQAEEELRGAKETAEAASRAKSAFLATMSHEIRTPLNAVIGLTGLVLETEMTVEQREYLDLVRESGESLLQVINDILDFSKIEAGRMELERVVFDHAEMLGNAMKVLGMRAHGKGLELLHRLAPDLPPVLIGDPGRLRQVIVNLVGNAVKFTDCGEVIVNVELESQHNGKATLHYTVADSGVGIPPEKLEGIFEAFEQVETTASRRFGGTGLGLAICRRLVDLMDGRIWVESEVGRGTKFHFTAQLAVAEQPAAEPATPEVLRHMPVLVVDDNATGRRILCEMIRNWSMVPTEAADGADALRRLREAAANRPFKLVLADAHMPEVDGFALAEQIANDQRLAGTVIMMLSSGDRPGEVERCERLGVATHLVKPVKQSELLDAIMLALRITAADESPKPPAARQSRIPPLRVLLAEDSLVNQKLASVLLERQGHRVEIAGHGREALDKLKAGRFDLVLMDVQMPEMDGFDATKIIRARERTTDQHLPIVALTAHAMKGDEQRCLDAGMDGYVAKPLRADELFAAMDRAVQDARFRGAQRAGQTGPEAGADSSRIPPEQDGGPIDWSVALEKAHGDEELLVDLAKLLIDELPRRLAEIDDSFAAGDVATAERAAHSLKGHFRVFGAHAATDYALQVEMNARDGDLAAKALRASLKQEAQRVRAALLEFTKAHTR